MTPSGERAGRHLRAESIASSPPAITTLDEVRGKPEDRKPHVATLRARAAPRTGRRRR